MRDYYNLIKGGLDFALEKAERTYQSAIANPLEASIIGLGITAILIASQIPLSLREERKYRNKKLCLPKYIFKPRKRPPISEERDFNLTPENLEDN
jgi:hypothetical protein